MNTKQQGDIGVSVAISYYTLLGYTVSFPLTDNSKYDLIVEKSGHLVRVQCKSTRYKRNEVYEVMVKTNGGNQSWNGQSKKLDASEFDMLFVFAFDGNCYIFPPEAFHNKGSIKLGAKNKQYKVWEITLPS